MRKGIAMILAFVTMFSMFGVVALAQGEQPVIVVDGVKDSAYTDTRMLDHSLWSFFDEGYQPTEPLDPERVKNTVWFTWDDESVYIYFQCVSKDELYKPAEDETEIANFDEVFYEIAQIYLDTAPNMAWNAPCIWAGQDGNGDTCAHIACNSRGGDGSHYRLMARANPAWGEWNDYFENASGMFMDFETYSEKYQGREGYDDMAAKYAEAHGNGEGQAATFIDYDTNTYGFEMKFPRAQGEDHFQLNIRTRVNEKEWEEWGPEPAYSLSFCSYWWLNSDAMLEIYYADYEDISGNFQYDLFNGEATITGYTGAGGAVTIPAQINGTPVVAIGNKAFANQNSVTSVTLPATLKTIGNRAFYGCTALTDLNIPQGVEVVEKYAFCGCSSLKTVTIPQSVTTLGNQAFSVCFALESFNVSAENANYSVVDGVLFNKQKTTLIQYPAMKTNTSYTVPATVTEIQDEAFYGAKNLTKVNLTDGITRIGSCAFYDCVNLKNITLPAGLISLGDSAFFNCSQITSINLSSKIDQIPYAAFGGCIGITAIELPSTITAIDEYAFFGCENLSSIVVPVGVKSIANSAFKDCNSSLVISGEEGSYAQTYAVSNGFEFKVSDNSSNINAAKEVEELIGSLPATVTVSTQSLIELCRTKYNALSPAAKALVTNYAKLEQAEKDLEAIFASQVDDKKAAEQVVSLIATLPDVITVDYQSVIQLCRTKYSLLSETAKPFVTNYDKLQKAEEDLTALLQKEVDEAAAKKVDDLITKLPVEVTEENKHLVDEAQKAYEELTESQQALVTRKGELMIAISAKKILNLISLINSLPAVITKADADTVAAARQAYDALGATEQAMITNYNALVLAEETVQNLASVVYGDVNGDGAVNAKDALSVLKAAVGKEDLSSMQKTAAEVDKNAGISAKDALEILKFSVNKIELFPVEVIQ